MSETNKRGVAQYYFNVIFKGESKELIPVHDPEKERDLIVSEKVIQYAI